MKNKMYRFIAVLLLLCVTGCSSAEAPSGNITGMKERAGNVAKGDLEANSVIIAVGNKDVTYQEYQMYSYLLQSKYDTVLDEKIWKYDISKDRTLGTEAVEEIIRLIIQLKVIEKEAVKQKLELTVDEKEEIAFNVDKFLEKVSDQDKKKYNITAEMFRVVLENNVLARMMYDVVTGAVNEEAVKKEGDGGVQSILSEQIKVFQEKYKKWTENYEVRVSESILERELFE